MNYDNMKKVIIVKKIVVISDNHGDDHVLKHILTLEKADYYIHCGDSETHQESLLAPYIPVKGNNDWFISLPSMKKIVIEEVPILIMHGERLGYFNREIKMQHLLQEHHCLLLISGHTHIPLSIQEGAYVYFNPGSTSLPRGGSTPSYGVIYIDGALIRTEIKPYQR